MNRFSVIVAAACSAVVLPCSAGAERLQPVLVTATRTPAVAQDILASVDWIGADELARSTGGELADLLRLRGGLEAVRLGGPGQQTSLFLRGTDSNHVLVLLDGVKINPATIGTASIQNIAPALVERVEIVKGPRSTLYGSEAMGGVINVITRQGAAAPTRFQLGSGRYNTHSASLSSGWASDTASASLGLAWLDSAGFPTRSGNDQDRGYSNRSLTLAGRSQIGTIEFGARLWHAAGTSEYSDFLVSPVDQDFDNTSLAMDARFAPAAQWDARISLSRMLDEIAQNQSSDRLQTRRWQLDWQNDIAIGEHHALSAGLLLQREDATSVSFGTAFDTQMTTHQFYLQDQMAWARHSLLLAAGQVDHEAFGGHASWNAEYGYLLGDATRLVLGAGSGFRAPDASDLYRLWRQPGTAARAVAQL